MADSSKHLKTKKLILNILFLVCVGIIEVILLSLLYYVIDSVMLEGGHMFKALALGLIIMWVAVLIGYLAWAMYFFNINHGKTNQVWAGIHARKEAGVEEKGESKNPHGEQTLGLPPGTIRGVMALSLLFGALAMMIAALGSDSTYSENEFFVDNFEFFKTAFLMMIAFYFGDKSLKYLRNKKCPPNQNQGEGNANDININQNIGIASSDTNENSNTDMMTGNIDMDAIRNEMSGDLENANTEEEDDQDDFNDKTAEG